jgi:uncharacterized RmlC-like cupin family protein
VSGFRSGFRVIRPADRAVDTGSGVMHREAAISKAVVGAEALWFGYVELAPGAASAVHHHGDSESAIYVISGHPRFYSGPTLAEVHDAEPGDFIWVPPHEVHVETNRSTTEPVRIAVARSTQEAIVVNLPDPEGWPPASTG